MLLVTCEAKQWLVVFVIGIVGPVVPFTIEVPYNTKVVVNHL